MKKLLSLLMILLTSLSFGNTKYWSASEKAYIENYSFKNNKNILAFRDKHSGNVLKGVTVIIGKTRYTTDKNGYAIIPEYVYKDKKIPFVAKKMGYREYKSNLIIDTAFLNNPYVLMVSLSAPIEEKEEEKVIPVEDVKEDKPMVETKPVKKERKKRVMKKEKITIRSNVAGKIYVGKIYVGKIKKDGIMKFNINPGSHLVELKSGPIYMARVVKITPNIGGGVNFKNIFKEEKKIIENDEEVKEEETVREETKNNKTIKIKIRID